jgi:hypothetical protein
MKQAIIKLAKDILGEYIDESEVEIIPRREGGAYYFDNMTLEIYACVKAYGDGYTEWYDSDHPHEREQGCRELSRGPEFSDAVRAKFPKIGRVRVHIDHD